MNSDQIATINEYYWAVADEAVKLGYSIAQVGIFYSDIIQYFNDGKSIETCLEEVF